MIRYGTLLICTLAFATSTSEARDLSAATQSHATRTSLAQVPTTEREAHTAHGAAVPVSQIALMQRSQDEAPPGSADTPSDTQTDAARQAAGAAFLAANARRADVETLPSGLQYRSIAAGTGPRPISNGLVLVNYTGTLIDGTVFDDSRARGAPTQFRLNSVIPGFAEALALMHEGDHWEIVIPPALAYGEAGVEGSIPPQSVLVFDIELISTGAQVYNAAQSMPRFPGCEEPDRRDADRAACAEEKLHEFIYGKLEYPPAARENGIEGTVFARFIVELDGSLSEARIVRDIGGGCGAEVLRILAAMGTEGVSWSPGIERGRPVRVRVTLPVRFELE